jgi:hypothetical protein
VSRWLQPPIYAGSSLTDFSTLKMEAIHSSETSVHTRSTRRHNPDDGILHSHRRENLKSYMLLSGLYSLVADKTPTETQELNSVLIIYFPVLCH